MSTKSWTKIVSSCTIHSSLRRSLENKGIFSAVHDSMGWSPWKTFSEASTLPMTSHKDVGAAVLSCCGPWSPGSWLRQPMQCLREDKWYRKRPTETCSLSKGTAQGQLATGKTQATGKCWAEQVLVSAHTVITHSEAHLLV